MNVAIYARVSTTDQDCTIQLTELRRYIIARGWTIAGEYADNGVSGIKASRPALDEVMEAARMRRIDAVAVWKLDRFSRSISQCLAQVQALEAAGVRFMAVSQAIDTDQSNPAGRLFLHMLAAIAEFEREMIRERTAAGRAKARAAGVHMGRPRLVVDRQRVTDLRMAGRSWRQVAAELGCSVAKAHSMQ